mmetsp:Transcript_90/g.236  ORF Transcript_90/g.236 Transcript_90/m.236 type:complete len:463 (-) Transcript_90:59-1447(-)|eukprot:CAMPEP_0195515790 /NCGR_PEP_ID=MMETSP0794_2-20130614/6732_1 /TAXON_ID=515487 /ORGANISM="Stephanopyxis turris, Strain CCMP 815" /LENGTH=462 /DNA_ID=CAMNT_0040644271 /DNA_START=111 /DNA_END=1499 /DNA_ORIENTATION=+
MEKYNMLLVSVPTKAYSSDSVPFADIRQSLEPAAAKVHTFNIPKLKVGTLDSLMILDQELAKVDVIAEQSLNKIQRQYDDLISEYGGDNSKLLVLGTLPTEFLENFSWDEARYSHTRKLNELVRHIQSSIGKIDDDMKVIGQSFNEIKQHLTSLQRKRGANLMVADLKDVLSQEACLDKAGQTPDEIFYETNFLESVAVVVPVAAEEDFLASYATLCADAVSLKDGTTFSPVVPGSHMEVIRDTDGYILYRVLLLKGQAQQEATEKAAPAESEGGGDKDQAENEEEGNDEENEAAAAANQKSRDFFTLFSDACRAKRFLVKKYEPAEEDADETQNDTGTLDTQISKAKEELDRQMSYLKRRSGPYFEDVYVAWTHIKAIRVFVESVLRYGVPPNFHASLIIPSAAKNMRKIRQVLQRRYEHLDELDVASLKVSEDVQRIMGPSSSTGEYLPYISVSINFVEV